MYTPLLYHLPHVYHFHLSPFFLFPKTSKHPLPHNTFLPPPRLFSRNASLLLPPTFSPSSPFSLPQYHPPPWNPSRSLHTPSPVTASWANLVLQGNPTTFLLIPPPNEVTRYEAPGVVVGEEEEKNSCLCCFYSLTAAAEEESLMKTKLGVLRRKVSFRWVSRRSN